MLFLLFKLSNMFKKENSRIPVIEMRLKNNFSGAFLRWYYPDQVLGTFKEKQKTSC